MANIPRGQLQLFLNVYDNMRAASTKEVADQTQYGTTDNFYTDRLNQFRASPDFVEYMTPLAETLNRPDLLKNIPAKSTDPDNIQIVDEIYAQIKANDTEYLKMSGLTDVPLSPTLSKAQIDAFMSGTNGIADGKPSTTIDVPKNLVLAHPIAADIAAQSADTEGLTGADRTAALDAFKRKQKEAVTELEHGDYPVIPGAPQKDAMAVYQAVDTNNEQVVALTAQPPQVQIASADRIPAIPSTPVVDVGQQLNTLDQRYADAKVTLPPVQEVQVVVVNPTVVEPVKAQTVEPVKAETVQAQIVNPTADTATTFKINAAQIADASILLDGKGKNDMAFLKDVAKEAKRLGVDQKLIDQIEKDADTKGFVTSAAATKGVQAYADTLKKGLSDGGLDNVEYKAALSNLFTGIAGGVVLDRKGISDDIAAPAGTEQKAKQAMHNALG